MAVLGVLRWSGVESGRGEGGCVGKSEELFVSFCIWSYSLHPRMFFC